MALALIHLRTNNKKIADRITLPKTFYALEKYRPSDVLLKVLCKNLILWDSIEASQEWLNSQIPEIISTIYLEKDIEKVERIYQTRISPEEIDYANIAMEYTYFLTGSLFSIGFKYAGSGNRDVFKFLCKNVDKIIKMKITNSTNFKANISPKYTNSNKNDIDERTYQSCLCVAAYAISMVMAGTGDVDSFIILRRIRKILERSMHYGFNMAIHMSIGFLFLGSGKYTFSTSNLSIASLLMALYPSFPDHPDDNRYHLQALRHFYVLAIENKLLQTVDVETGELVSVPLEIKYKNSTEDPNSFGEAMSHIRNVKTPIMLEDMHKIARIQLKDKKYYEIVIDKPEILKSHLQKGSQSVFQRASYLVEKPELQCQKSSSKMSMNSPFEVITEQSEINWIPKMIYVKKKFPLETENSINDKIYLSPFEFSKDLLQILKDKQIREESKNDEESEEEETEVEDFTRSNIISNKVFNEISEITKNPILQRFLRVLCYYNNVIYSELEPLVIKGINEKIPEGESYTDTIRPDDYIDIMNETENLADDLEDDCKKTRVIQKEFNLGILYECFIKSRTEVLPIYLRLFANSLGSAKFENHVPLIKEGRLVLMFYKGLYQTSFNQPDISTDLDDVPEKLSNETLINKRFLEELQEIMNLHSKKPSELLQGQASQEEMEGQIDPSTSVPSSLFPEQENSNQSLLSELFSLI